MCVPYPFDVPVHIFVSVAPAVCERCGGRWPDIDAALRERCEVRRAA